ncbi:hypothetical protein SUGI_0457510 [Cryptomeria japonica]|nr:hypothetical protein SUGI_0457510 [Cryptomeria japonica]
MASLKLVLELELKKKPAIDEENTEMDHKIWSRLPQELLLLVLAKLPTLVLAKFRVICKQWKFLLSPPANNFKRISFADISCNPSPAFLIGGLSFAHTKNSVLNDLYLLQSTPLLGAPDAPSLFYICNPVTRTWKMLPPLVELRSRQDFIGLAFDSFRKTFLLITGEYMRHENQNTVVMEMYDSETDSWSKLEINTPISLFPTGEGVYSRGRFYWINQTIVGSMLRLDVAAFNVAERSWDVINQPEHFCYGKLTGYDGNVILVDNKDLSLWKLNEDVKEKEYSWLEFEVFPRNLYEEFGLKKENVVNEFSRQRNPQVGLSYNHSQVVVNSCGWILIHLYQKKLVVVDAEGRTMRSIEGKLLTLFEQAASPLPLHGYEVNNVWWP